MKIVLFIMALLAFGGIKECDSNRPPDKKEIVKTLDATRRFEKASIKAVTLKGAKVRAEQPITQEDLDAVDLGLDQLFAKNIAVGYTNNSMTPKTHDKYEVALFKGGRENDAEGRYSPDYDSYAFQYAGTDYAHPCAMSKEHQCIWIAGQMIRTGAITSNDAWNGMIVHHIIVGDHDRDFSRMSDIVMYEGEHVTLFYEDGEKFQRTETHSTGGHPLY